MGADFIIALQRLHRHHGVRPRFKAVHSAAATDQAQIVEGLASSIVLWPERVLVRPFAYGAKLPASVPLLYRHRSHEVAGAIEELKYTEAGELYVRARVDMPAARLCNAFSVGLGGIDVEWFNLDDARTFYAAITRVDAIEEISLTPMPRDAGARIQSRRAVNVYDNCFREVRRIRTLLAA